MKRIVKRGQLSPEYYSGTLSMGPVEDILNISVPWHRTIEIKEGINPTVSSTFCNIMHGFLNEDPEEMITIVLNCHGGTVEDCFGMYDVIRHARKTCIVRTIAFGRAYSAGALLLACGSKGYRYSYPSSTIMIHGIQLEGIVSGALNSNTLPMIENAKEDMNLFAKYLTYEISKDDSEKDPAAIQKSELFEERLAIIKKVLESDTYLRPSEAKDLGIIDKIGIPEFQELVEEQDGVQLEISELVEHDDLEEDHWNLIPSEEKAEE